MNVPWFVRNDNIHGDLRVEAVLNFVLKSFKRFIENLALVPLGFVAFNVGPVTGGYNRDFLTRRIFCSEYIENTVFYLSILYLLS